MEQIEAETSQLNADVVKTLFPQSLWHHFATLCNTPRPSFKEGQAADLVARLASENKCEIAVRDEHNNLLIRVPATEGYEHHPVLCLQSHLDMVTVPDENIWPIPLQIGQDGTLNTGGKSTLGADNGIGVAAMMAIMTGKNIAHGPLELLFTVIEEVGLEGAEKFDYSCLQSTNIINLDSEEWGQIFVGCAGGIRLTGYFAPEYIVDEGNFGQAYILSVQGLDGGHSGLEIDKNGGNAIKILATLISRLGDYARLVDFNGGTKMNVIPSEATATVMITETHLQQFELDFQRAVHALTPQYPAEKLAITFKEGTGNSRVMTPASQGTLLKLLAGLPHGVWEKKGDLVFTSTNLAVVETGEKEIKISTFTRSFGTQDINDWAEKIAFMYAEAGGRSESGNKFLPWEPQEVNPLRDMAVREYQGMFDAVPDIVSIPAGLECAVFYQKMKDREVNIISFGPTITGAHGTKEAVDIATVGVFWNFLLALLTAE